MGFSTEEECKSRIARALMAAGRVLEEHQANPLPEGASREERFQALRARISGVLSRA